jgi:hypothetical protein
MVELLTKTLANGKGFPVFPSVTFPVSTIALFCWAKEIETTKLSRQASKNEFREKDK